MNQEHKTEHTHRSPAGLLFGMVCQCVALIAFDQFTKRLAVFHLKNQPPVVLINGVLELTYVENRGAAFGMLQNQQWFFWILTAVFLAVAVYVLLRVPKTARYAPLIVSVTVLAAGAIGNLIDRVAHRYVVDFIYFSAINFPVFNVADIYVTLSVIALLILFFFRYKEDELSFLSWKKKSADKAGEEDA